MHHFFLPGMLHGASSHQRQSIDRFADTAVILISIVSNSYYGMLSGQIHINLPPEHPIMSFETIEVKMATVSAKRSMYWPFRNVWGEEGKKPDWMHFLACHWGWSSAKEPELVMEASWPRNKFVSGKNFSNGTVSETNFFLLNKNSFFPWFPCFSFPKLLILSADSLYRQKNLSFYFTKLLDISSFKHGTFFSAVDFFSLVCFVFLSKRMITETWEPRLLLSVRNCQH